MNKRRPNRYGYVTIKVAARTRHLLMRLAGYMQIREKRKYSAYDALNVQVKKALEVYKSGGSIPDHDIPLAERRKQVSLQIPVSLYDDILVLQGYKMLETGEPVAVTPVIHSLVIEALKEYE